MSVPPSLPSRPSQSAAAPQLPPRNKPTATAPQNNDKVLAQDERKPSKSPSQPITPRFIAPPPTTDAASKLQHMLQPVFNFLAFKPEDTPEDAALRRQLEEEQISRYMNSFSKHVQYLRMDGGTRVQEGRLGDGSRPDDKDVMHRIPQKPQKEAFRVVHPVDPVTEAGDTAANSHVDKSNNHGSVPDLQKEESFEVDWFGYYAALAAYYLHLYIPSLPSNTIRPIHPSVVSHKIEREPFTIARLRSSVERLYVNARSPWETLFLKIGHVAMWHDIGLTIKWLSVYVLLIVTSTFTPFLFCIPLYHLIYERLFPPTVAQLIANERDAERRLQEGHELADDIIQPPSSSATSYIPSLPGGFGGSTDFATGVAARGFNYARDSVSTYAWGKAEDEDAAVNEDILRPHVQAFVSGIIKQGGSTTPDQAGTAAAAEAPPLEEEHEGQRGKEEEGNKKSKKGKTEPSSGKSKTTKLRARWDEFKVVHGTGLIVVLDDLADMHERVESLFAWRRPESSVKFAMILLLAILGTHFMPAMWMLKLFQVAIGVVFFVVIPVAARMERYEPISASMTSAPTMAEHVINVMRDRSARGEPLPEYRPALKAPSRKGTAMSTAGSITTSDQASTTSLPLTTTETQDELVRVDTVSDTDGSSIAPAVDKTKRKVDWSAMRDQAITHAHTGTQWWQTGKELWKGEKKVQFSWKGRSEEWDNIDNSALAAQQVSLGAHGPGLHLSVHSTGEPSPYIKEGVSYLARHAGHTGSLYLSSEGLMFVPMIGSAAESDKTPLSATLTQVLQEGEQEEKKGLSERQKPEVQVPMSAIVGMRKSNKTAMGCIVSAGLQIDVDDGSSIVFSFVANRDVVFNRLLALSKGTFRRV